MSTVVIKQLPAKVEVPIHVRCIWHTLRIARFEFEWTRFDKIMNAFEITFFGETYWLGVKENRELAVVTPTDKALPELLKKELLTLAERSERAIPYLYESKVANSEFPLKVDVTFRPGRW